MRVRARTVGIASYPGDGTSFQTLLSVADRRHYPELTPIIGARTRERR